ncbi:acyl-CoA synthetase [Streptomyces tanashiensis]|uniref:AMP-binding protein n=1 Tax=Streptomyces tanashiensis TaxID=67367 RepID=A0ABY6QV38_9ACTN|nr:AMP-binding protein [Streptomyces tanashiensis]UZX20883.1 AMP-binding protein [Streptomyces tanashiensis]GGY35657.1 AMP-dependent synthetase [Streptomyces tanashiensis]
MSADRTSAHEEYRAARDLLLRLRGDHAAARAAFRWPRAEHFNWALDWFDVIAEGNDRPALELLGRPAEDGSVPVVDRVSFAELSARSDALATALRERGVARGDRVLVLLGTRTELWETLLGCVKLGAVVVPGYQDLTRDEAADRITRGRIRHLVCAPELLPLLDALPVPGLRTAPGADRAGWSPYPDTRAPGRRPFLPDGPTRAADPSFCYFTSGTTSLPKLVEHSHAGYGVGHLSSLYWSGLRPGDRHLNLSAPGWAKHSWSSFFVPWAAEATVLAPPDGGLPPDVLPRVLATQGVTSLCAPPSAWRAMLPYVSGGTGSPRLREATAAGEPLTAETAARVQAAWGVRIRDGYGQTEATALIGRAPGGAEPLAPLGHPLPGYRIVLRDPETGEQGETGEVCVDLTDRPPGLMRGYADLPERTAEAFAGGLYRTGDRGERCADGSIRLLGRMDEVFKSHGHRVSPPEIEAVLRTHPEVADAAVVPRPDPHGGLAPYAVVELHGAPAGGPGPAGPGAVPGAGCETSGDRHRRVGDELLALAAERLAPVFVPHGVEVVPRLPRTRSGKVRRGALTPGPGGR